MIAAEGTAGCPVRVLHVLNATRGGATMSAVETVRAADDPSVEHFAVYPGRAGACDELIDNTFASACALPLPGWNVSADVGLVRRVVTAAAVARLTRFQTAVQPALSRVLKAWKIDVVKTNCAANIAGAQAARRAGLPHLWHIRERIGNDGSMRFRLGDERLVRTIEQLSHTVAAVSDFVAGPFRKWEADERLEVVYDGVDVQEFSSEDAARRGVALREEWRVSPEALLVGKVANLTSRVKRHDLFIEAASLLCRSHPDVRVVLVGAIPGDTGWLRRPAFRYVEELRRQCRSAGIDDLVIWAGESKDPAAVMNAIDVLGHACDVEGFPRVVIEAMAAGKPVVGPNDGGVVEGIGQSSGSLLVAARDPLALAKGLSRFVADRDLRRSAGESGQRRVARRFDIRDHARVLDGMVRRALTPRKSTVEGRR